MNKKQKRLGNKGFSLVELIVVIAIMAILVAVLAPTLISKIEDSREGTDIQAIGEIKTQVTNILGNEKIYSELVDTSKQVYKYNPATMQLSPDTGTKTLTETNAELQEVLEKVELKSKAAKGKTIYVHISSAGKVYVEVAKADAASTAVVTGKTYGNNAVTSGDNVFAVGTYN